MLESLHFFGQQLVGQEMLNELNLTTLQKRTHYLGT